MLFLLANTTLPPTTQWIVLAVGVAGVAILILRPRYKRKDPMEDGSLKLSLAQQRSVERQMSNLLVELSEMARRITAQLDSRAAKLELLIKEADEKIAALKAVEQTRTEPTPKPSFQPNSPPKSSERFQSMRIVSPPLDDDEDTPTLNLEPPDPRYEQVYMLADQGRSAIEIAKKLGRPSGEIELILALRPKS
jgi:hypothetical protein